LSPEIRSWEDAEGPLVHIPSLSTVARLRGGFWLHFGGKSVARSALFGLLWHQLLEVPRIRFLAAFTRFLSAYFGKIDNVHLVRYQACARPHRTVSCLAIPLGNTRRVVAVPWLLCGTFVTGQMDVMWLENQLSLTPSGRWRPASLEGTRQHSPGQTLYLTMCRSSYLLRLDTPSGSRRRAGN